MVVAVVRKGLQNDHAGSFWHCVLSSRDDFTRANLSSDGTRIVTASPTYRDNTVRIWDAESGREIHVLQGHED